jgi:SH3-like domain-containing protein
MGKEPVKNVVQITPDIGFAKLGLPVEVVRGFEVYRTVCAKADLWGFGQAPSSNTGEKSISLRSG